MRTMVTSSNKKTGDRMVNLVLALCLLLSSSATVFAQTPYYQGKQVKVVVGFTTGGFYDRWARLLSRYMPKYIPGNPSFVVQNMPGAGSVIAANYVYGVAKPDGLTIGSLNPAIYMDQLIGRKEVQFDWSKFNWIGTPEQTDFVFFMRGESPYKSIEDIRKAAEPPKCGSTGTG